MRDYWIDGLIAVTTMGSLYWTLTWMAQQPALVITSPVDSKTQSTKQSGDSRDTEATAIATPTLILGSDQPIDDDPDFDIDLDDLGAIATFENQRL